MDVQLPEWLRWMPEFDTLIGFEEDEEEDEGEEEESEDEEDESEEDEDDESGDDKGKKQGSKKAAQKKEAEEATGKLKSALRKERQSRRALAKELKELKAKLPPDDKDEDKSGKDDKGKDDAELTRLRQEQKDREAENRRQSERLAAKLQTNALDTAIIKVLQDPKLPKFRDSDDVLRLITRKDIDVEQDDDDPSDVEVDMDDVRDAIKSLAKAKPHLLVEKTGDRDGEGRERSGSSFGGRSRKSKDSDKDALTSKFPALSRKR